MLSLSPSMEEEEGEGLTALSHRPRMTPSSVSVARNAFSRVEKSKPIKLVMTRLTRRGATSPACGASGGGNEVEVEIEADDEDEG